MRPLSHWRKEKEHKNMKSADLFPQLPSQKTALSETLHEIHRFQHSKPGLTQHLQDRGSLIWVSVQVRVQLYKMLQKLCRFKSWHAVFCIKFLESWHKFAIIIFLYLRPCLYGEKLLVQGPKATPPPPPPKPTRESLFFLQLLISSSTKTDCKPGWGGGWHWEASQLFLIHIFWSEIGTVLRTVRYTPTQNFGKYPPSSSYPGSRFFHMDVR